MTYADYTKAVGDLQVVTDKLRRQLSDDGQGLHAKLSAVLDHYLYALEIWKRKLGKDDLQREIWANGLWQDKADAERLRDDYGVIPYPDAWPQDQQESWKESTKNLNSRSLRERKWIPLEEALGAIWAKAVSDLANPNATPKPRVVPRSDPPSDGGAVGKRSPTAEDQERLQREADDRASQQSLVAIREAKTREAVEKARAGYTGTRHAAELDLAVQSQLDGFAWKRTSLRLSLIDHTGFILSVAFSPDGKYVLTGSNDHTARLWDAATGKKVRVFKGHSDGVSSVAFSPDGKFVLTGSWDKTVRLWDFATGKETRRFKGHALVFSSVAFSPDGRLVVAASLEGALVIWDAATGKETRKIACDMDRLYSVAYSPDGKYLLTCGRDMTARLWDAATGREIRKFKGHTNEVYSVAFSPDGKFVLTGSLDNTARLWDAATGEEIRKFNGHTSFVLSVAFSPDGKYVMTGSNDYRAMIWSTASGSLISTLEVHSECVFAVAFSPDGKSAMTGSGDFTARMWRRLDD